MKAINSALLRKFLKTGATRLKGDWLLMGGALLPALGVDSRVTVDIDLVPLPPDRGSSGTTLALLELAASLGLPVETINSAAAYFLSREKFSKGDLVLLQEGGDCRIFRPSAPFFLRLKVSRLTESDLSDIREYLRLFPNEWKSEREKLGKIVLALRKKEQGSSKKERLEALLKMLE